MFWEAASEARILFLLAVIFIRDQSSIGEEEEEESWQTQEQRAAVWVSQQRRVGQAEDNGRHLTCSSLRRAQLFCTSCDLRTGRQLRGLRLAGFFHRLLPRAQRRWKTFCSRAGVRGAAWNCSAPTSGPCSSPPHPPKLLLQRNETEISAASSQPDGVRTNLSQRNFPTFPWQFNDFTDTVGNIYATVFHKWGNDKSGDLGFKAILLCMHEAMKEKLKQKCDWGLKNWRILQQNSEIVFYFVSALLVPFVDWMFWGLSISTA